MQLLSLLSKELQFEIVTLTIFTSMLSYREFDGWLISVLSLSEQTGLIHVRLEHGWRAGEAASLYQKRNVTPSNSKLALFICCVFLAALGLEGV